MVKPERVKLERRRPARGGTRLERAGGRLWRCALVLGLLAVLAFAPPHGRTDGGPGPRAAGASVTTPAADRAERIPVVMYHHLLPDNVRLALFPHKSFVLSTDRFAAQMAYLHQHGFHTATTAELLAFLHGELDLPRRTVVLTFDDGYESNYFYAYPLLRDYGYRATLFVIGNAVWPKNGPFKPYRLTYVDAGQLREMVESGVFEIGNHTFAMHRLHPDGVSYLCRADFDTQLRDFRRLHRMLELLDLPVPAGIAYPYGQYNADTLAAARQAGLVLGFTVREGYVYPGDNPLELPRFDIISEMTMAEFAALVNPEG